MSQASHRKIYLSKSNLASVEHVRTVRAYLEGLGYEIVEHDGGPYNAGLLGTAAIMVMVGYDMGDGDIMYVGKGQYNQLDDREKHGFDYTQNLYVTEVYDDNQVQFYEAESGDVRDSNSWKKDYGEIQLIDEAFIDEFVRAKPQPEPEPTTRTTDPMTMKTVDRLEMELEGQLAEAFGSDADIEWTVPKPFHLACYTLLH